MKRATPNFLKSILDFEIIQRPLKTIPMNHTQLGHTQSDHPCNKYFYGLHFSHESFVEYEYEKKSN